MSIQQPRADGPRAPVLPARTERRLWEQGSALIVCLLATTVLLVVGSALVLVAQSEAAIVSSGVRDAQTLYAAEAALRHAAVDLEMLPDWTPALAGVATSVVTDGPPAGAHTSEGVTVDLSGIAATLNAGAAALPFGANNPRWMLYLWGDGNRLLPGTTWPGYVLVWIADDAAEADDDPQRDGNDADGGRGVVRLRAEAFAAGGAHRVIEATAMRLASGRVRLLDWQGVR